MLIKRLTTIARKMQPQSHLPFEEYSYSSRPEQGKANETTGPNEAKRARRKKIADMKIAPATTLGRIKEWREKHEAPVDTMGCERLHDPTAPPLVQKFQTLVALMLSVQTNDKTTSKVVERLKGYGLTPEAMSAVPPQKLVELIYECNFNRRKASNIIEVARRVLQSGRVGDTQEEIMSYPGVGVKIATIYLSAAEGRQEGIGVDTHVHRIANRLGWVKTTDPKATEERLQEVLPREAWPGTNIALVGFGQVLCEAKKPQCPACPVAEQCPSFSLSW